MGKSRGLRSGTRYAFSRDFKKHGVIPMSVYLKTYKVGDIVDVVANAAAKSLPHKWYHGKTGVVFNVTKSSVGVIINKPVGNRYIEKRLAVRVEHVRHSKCRLDFINRVKETAAKKIEARANGVRVELKRIPAQPREAHVVAGAVPENVYAIPYETYI
ncbi:ribosomal 60S subunit protein L21B [Starmerella bacillaris]|uniref:Ribosomal 60S subunit protein L21B n=1 Tax=Starmerella bacillaris TaxID=1247836 RepID=A0AAV5RE37_STABA|nr:ribosomal 60S subunit protein L21B [Starmerella bacillaris]